MTLKSLETGKGCCRNNIKGHCIPRMPLLNKVPINISFISRNQCLLGGVSQLTVSTGWAETGCVHSASLIFPSSSGWGAVPPTSLSPDSHNGISRWTTAWRKTEFPQPCGRKSLPGRKDHSNTQQGPPLARPLSFCTVPERSLSFRVLLSKGKIADDNNCWHHTPISRFQEANFQYSLNRLPLENYIIQWIQDEKHHTAELRVPMVWNI